MNNQELINKYENKLKDVQLKFGESFKIKVYEELLEDFKQLDKPQPTKLKDVIVRIKELDIGARKVWLDEIINELGGDYGTLKYKDGYEQGKFDGSMEYEKVPVPQFVADWYEEHKDDFEIALFRCIDHIPSVYDEGDLNEFEEWIIDGETKPFQTLVNMHQFGYEIEKEKRYLVKVIGMSKFYECLNFDTTENRWKFFDCDNTKTYRTHHTRKELEDADFGWVFDCPGIDIEEVGK